MGDWHRNFMISVALGATLGFGACKTGRTSELSHEFGKTRVDPFELIDCRQILTEAPAYPQATTYVQNILNHITTQNPQTFRDVYAPESFCIDLQEGPFNAVADPQTGIVTVFTGVVKAAMNDAEIAAVLSHEIAHITMQHMDLMTQADWQKMGEDGQTKVYDRFDVMFDLDDLMLQLEQEQATLKELGEKQPDDRQAIQTSRQRIQDLEKSIQAKQRELETSTVAVQAASQEKLGDKDQAFSSVEREADEVGFEFYLRAGFHPAAFGTIMRSFYPVDVIKQQGEFLKCLANITFPVGGNPDRGSEFHPSPCWRLYNVTVGEQQRHREDYKPFLQRATLTTITGAVSLAEAKKELLTKVP